MDATTTALAEMLTEGRRDEQENPSRRIRNYKAMGNEKLQRVARELFDGGEAYDRCVARGSGDPNRDMLVVCTELTERGLEF